MFSQQVVWITGASSGIGEALALRFAAEGAILVLSARRKDELKRVKQACADAGLAAEKVLVLPLDVTDEAAMPGAVAQVIASFGCVDLLINNAGISQRSLCVDTDMAVYRRLFDVDVMGQIALTKAVLPTMLERGRGHIVIISSVAGKVGVPYRTGYCAAKHAVIGFFEALRAEVAPAGLKVTTVLPGFIRTQISANALRGDGSAFGREDKEIAGGMDVHRCAQAIVDGLRRNPAELPVGDGREMQALWLRRFFPKVLFRKVSQMVSKPEA